MLEQKKILVTGGAGYIGAHTALALHEGGYTPVVIDNFSKSDRTLLQGIEQITNTPVILYEGNCRCKEFLKSVFQREKKIMGVMHFAAYKSVSESVQQPVRYYENNIGSLLSLLDVMQSYRVFNLIFSSSCTVYGETEQVPVDESMPFRKVDSPYGKTKQICEYILADFIKANPAMHIVSLRYFNPIGAHPTALLGELPIDKPNNLVPYIIRVAAGIYDRLTIFGDDYNTPDGTCIRDFIHVVDVAQAHVKALDMNMKRSNETCAIYNLGTGRGISVLQLVKKFIAITHAKVPYKIGMRRSGDLTKIYASVEKAKKELSWAARYSVEEALLHAWQWEAKMKKIKKDNDNCERQVLA